MLAEVCCSNKCARPILYFFSSGIFVISSVILWTPRDFGLTFTTVWYHAVCPLTAMLKVCDAIIARLRSSTRKRSCGSRKTWMSVHFLSETLHGNFFSGIIYHNQNSLSLPAELCFYCLINSISGWRYRWTEQDLAVNFDNLVHLVPWFCTVCWFVVQFCVWLVQCRLGKQ